MPRNTLATVFAAVLKIAGVFSFLVLIGFIADRVSHISWRQTGEVTVGLGMAIVAAITAWIWSMMSAPVAWQVAFGVFMAAVFYRLFFFSKGGRRI
ncbi:MAG: hypothetical protein WB630_01020 [Candidatus Acidiferrales bacterium]